jgi:hypothetical protein
MCGIDSLMTLEQALAFTRLEIEPAGQLGYFLECILGGAHGLFVGDLLAGMDGTAAQVARLLEQAIEDEQRHFLDATALSAASYRDIFGTIAQSGIQPLFELVKANR